MSSYMTSGWYEFLVPVRGAQGQDHLRVWIDMKNVVPMLKRLDLIYGDPDHPYCRDLTQVPDAARDLVAMVMDHIAEQPESVRRISVTRGLFADLNDRFDVGRSARILTLVNAVELPAAGQRLDAAEDLATVESQKTDITVTAPCPLTVVAVNEELASDPMRVRMDPYDGGWLVRAELPAGAWEELLDERGYRELVAQRS